ncbi:MAG: tetratricopeptide repeat protein [Alphaproteobacteria bacterium]|nr:tetratricopeptide repeat protein [Alphaproteobacteria bacterium]MCB9792761.1 tetratricopeptide repeat protein [Alphaproteobacteria bacterium]
MNPTLLLLAALALPAQADGPRRVLRTSDLDPSPEEQYAAKAHKNRQQEIAFAKELLSRTEDPVMRSELTLRLAELYAEDADRLHMEEMADYERRVDACFERSDCDPSTVLPDHTESLAYRTKAVQLYRHLLSTDPTFPRADEAHFYLADALVELGERSEAAREWLSIVRDFPDSPFTPDAYLLIGERYFDSGEVFKALMAYDRAAAFPDYERRLFALYKLGWCQYNVGEYGDAIRSMQRVVALSADAREAGDLAGSITLEEEALRDLVRFFADADQDEEARAYFRSLGREALARDMSERLVKTYMEQGKNEDAIALIRRLIAEDPSSAEVPALQAEVIEALRRMGDEEEALEALLRLGRDTGASSSWARTNAADPDVLAEATRIFDESLRRFAADQHSRARKLQGGAQAQEATRLADAAYAAWLEALPESPRAYDMRYGYGELLYAMGRFDEAWAQYVAVVDMDPKGRHSRFCAESAIFAAQEMAKGEPEPEGTEPVALSAWEQREIEAIGRFVALFPEEEPVRNMLYRSAYLLYAHNHFAEASERFRQVIAMEPGSKEAAQAAELILDSLALVEDWDTLAEVAREFHGHAALGDAAFKADVYAVYERARFKQAESVAAPLASAEAYMAFVAEFPDSEIGDKALNNAAVGFYAAERRAEAIAARESLLARYPESPARLDTLAALGFAYEEQAEFARAAELYEQLFAEDPEHAGARAALYSAALFRRALEERGQAVADYQRFLETWPEDVKSPLIRMDIAQLHEEQGQWAEAAEVYRASWSGALAEGYEPDQLAWMRLAHGRCLEAQGLDALPHYAASVAWMQSQEAGPFVTGVATQAEMMLRLTDPELERFLSLRIEGPKVPVSRAQEDRILAKQTSAKLDALASLKARYTEIVNLGGGEPSLVAAVRLGQLFEDMALTMGESHVPSYLTPEQREFYEMNLRDRVWQQQELAAEYYAFAVETGLAASLYEGPVAQAAERLSVLRPEDYPALEEALPEPAFLPSEPRTRALEMLEEPDAKVERE